jgi:hypothetical protein
MLRNEEDDPTRRINVPQAPTYVLVLDCRLRCPGAKASHIATAFTAETNPCLTRVGSLRFPGASQQMPRRSASAESAQERSSTQLSTTTSLRPCIDAADR